ncbi:MAG: sigma 54-interacting transcriptional regulator [Peptococcaceae bacterium]|nr:sigma 54-interacting transcriptional regulator [Peptococcaceae bacterium]
MDYKTRQLMRDLVQNPYMGIIVVDRECRIKFINQTYLDILGRSENEVLSRPVTEITPHSRLPEVIQKGQPILADLWQINGQEMVVARLPIMEDGQVIGAVGKSLFLDLAGARPLLEKLRHLEKELNYYRNELGSIYQARWRLDDLVGQSERMQRLKNLAVQVARTTSTILITGESGTGKELLAHAIHNASPRQNRPFVRVNCAAIPENLLESELFGYEEGAFTGAVKGGKPGKFELAHGGSIFLDEIGDMPVYMQTKLLRVLQEREVERLGGNRPLPVNVRVIAATNRHLEEMLKARQFRADLYYRLNVVTLHIPALRRRPEDLAKFLQHPGGLLNPFAVGRGKLEDAAPRPFPRRPRSGPHVSRRVPGAHQAVPFPRQFTGTGSQAVAHFLQPGGQAGVVQNKAGYFLKHPQALPGPVQVGVQHPVDFPHPVHPALYLTLIIIPELFFPGQ